jgi:hypothetical protein
MGLIGIGDKIGFFLNNDIKLDPNARVIYTMSIKKGPLRWVDTKLVTNQEINIFLSLIDSKIRSLLKSGVKLKYINKKYIKDKVSKNTPNNKISHKLKNCYGPSKIHSIKTIFASGKG